MVPYAAAGPLSGTVAPIRIVSLVTPTSLAEVAPPGAGAPLVGAGAALVAAGAGAPPVGAPPLGAALEQAASARLIRPSRTVRKLAELTLGDSFLVHPIDAPVRVAEEPRHAPARDSQYHQQQQPLNGPRRGIGQVLANGQQQLLGVDRQKLHKQTADQRPTDRADAAHHGAH